MVASSVQDLAVSTNCATLTLVMKTAWTSAPSSVRSITTSPSGDGCTGGDPIPKSKVSQSPWHSGVSLWIRCKFRAQKEILAHVKQFPCYFRFPRPVLAQCCINFHRCCLFLQSFFPSQKIPFVCEWSDLCVWNELIFLNVPLTAWWFSFPRGVNWKWFELSENLWNHICPTETA